MPRGGLRRGNKSEYNHLFKPKWNNKKTTAIRVPEVFKSLLLRLARVLDTQDISIKNSATSIVLFKQNNIEEQIKYIVDNSSENLDSISRKIYFSLEEQVNSNLQKQNINKYKIAVECFGEFVENQGLNMEELSKSRKGTKKHQLYEINQWLVEQSENSN